MGKKIKGTVELVFSEDDIKAELIFSPGDQETDLITPEEINKVFAEKKLLPLSLDNINTALSKVSHLTEKGAVFLAECRILKSATGHWKGICSEISIPYSFARSAAG